MQSKTFSKKRLKCLNFKIKHCFKILDFNLKWSFFRSTFDSYIFVYFWTTGLMPELSLQMISLSPREHMNGGRAKVRGILIIRCGRGEAQMGEVPRIRATGDRAPVLSAKVTGQIFMRAARAWVRLAASRRCIVSKCARPTAAALTSRQLQCNGHLCKRSKNLTAFNVLLNISFHQVFSWRKIDQIILRY